MPTPINPSYLRAAAAAVRLWWRRATTRRELRDLQPRQLDDIGLTERDRAGEYAKWFWQA